MSDSESEAYNSSYSDPEDEEIKKDVSSSPNLHLLTPSRILKVKKTTLHLILKTYLHMPVNIVGSTTQKAL